MKKLIPADTVDAEGTVWETTGENIRNGAKAFSESNIKSIVDVLFPVGSVYVGENAFVTSVGKWTLIETGNSRPCTLSYATPSGSLSSSFFVVSSQSSSDVSIAVRFWKRVS